MNIGIIGAGNIGSALARHFADAGHTVALSSQRGGESLNGVVQSVGEKAHAATVDAAIEFGEAVFLALPFGVYRSLPNTNAAGKLFVDATNYYPQRDGQIALLDQEKATSTQLWAAHFADAHLIKAFNTLPAQTLAAADHGAGTTHLALPFVGDSGDAKRTAASLIEVCGFAPLDVGMLSGAGARAMEPNGALYLLALPLLEMRAVVETL